MPPVPNRRGTPAGASGAALYCYIPFDLDAELREHARLYALPLSQVVRHALREHLGRAEPPPLCGCIPHRPMTGNERK